MSLTLIGLVMPVVSALVDFKEPMELSTVFLFDPPACEHQVIFPKQPQSVGVLMSDDQTFSAQLKVKDSFLRADCAPVSKDLMEQPKEAWLKNLMVEQMNKLGGNRLIILKYALNENHASYTGQIIFNNSSVMVNGAFYLGKHSLMTLTAIDKYQTRSSSDTQRFIASATHY